MEVFMAGHSKWANIKHKKAKTDAQKGQVFTKYSREIIVAAKMGGPDPAGNFRLKAAITAAKAAGLPNDNIKRAIEKGAGAGGNDNLESIDYEGYGPGGIAIIVETFTDNRNRTVGDIRSYFNKYKGNLGETGCVSYMFDKKGVIIIPSENYEEEQVLDLALNAGADDFENNEQEAIYRIITDPDKLQTVVEALEEANIELESSNFERIPQNIIEVTDTENAKYLMKLLDAIENHDDVQNVYANFDMDDSLLEEVSS